MLSAQCGRDDSFDDQKDDQKDDQGDGDVDVVMEDEKTIRGDGQEDNCIRRGAARTLPRRGPSVTPAQGHRGNRLNCKKNPTAYLYCGGFYLWGSFCNWAEFLEFLKDLETETWLVYVIDHGGPRQSGFDTIGLL